jgi:hypothetical protein
MEEIIPAFSAGVASTIICNPLDVLRVNIQLNKKIPFTRDIFHRGLFYGIIAIPSFWAIYFPVYSELKCKDINKSAAAYFSCCLASTVTTPIWILRQKAHTNIKHNWKNNPIKNYYKGLISTYLINLSFAVQMPLYEYLKSVYGNSPVNTFLNTAFSKTIASCIFYPLDTIRVKHRNGEDIKSVKIKNLYRGISLYIVRSIPYHTTVFCTYEFIKNNM